MKTYDPSTDYRSLQNPNSVLSQNNCRESGVTEVVGSRNNPNSQSMIGGTQPTNPSFWLNNGVLTFWDGVNNRIVDFDEGDHVDLAGNIVGDI